MRRFPIAGPVDAARHYCIPPLERVDLAEVLDLVDAMQYLVLHAPRQTGKTSTLLALRDLLNEGGEYRCVYVDFEPAFVHGSDLEAAMAAVVSQLEWWARDDPRHRPLAGLVQGAMELARPSGALKEVLSRWTEADPKPLVVLIDEFDALVGDAMISALHQIRSGYVARPRRFPQSVALCGLRDVRDYRVDRRAGPGPGVSPSPFNIKAESLLLGAFSLDDASALLSQHTEATGQPFTDDAVRTVWRHTRGQPWLVNALAHHACFRSEAGRDRTRPIDAEAILEAREALILRRDTHIDHLSHRLRDPRVRRVVEPILAGGDATYGGLDLQYARDLGLVAPDAPVRLANPIYEEVVPRELVYRAQEELRQEVAWYVADDGSLDVDGLLAAFQAFYRENSEHWIQRFRYREAGPQLLLQAFLQRIVNGGGRVHREHALGRRRTDLLVEWPRRSEGRGRWQDAYRHAIELEVLRGSLETAVAQGVEQTADYMDKCGASDGHLVIFDRREGLSWDQKVFRRVESSGDVQVTVWGM